MANNTSNVWAQMNYVPPRGQCNFKQSLISPRCPCLRFMLHPLKSSSSYECDGCSHHASFHSMENKAEYEIRQKWEQEAKAEAERVGEAVQRPKKRPRAVEYEKSDENEKARRSELLLLLSGTAGRSNSKSTAQTGSGATRTRRAAGARAKSRITELTEEDDDIAELD